MPMLEKGWERFGLAACRIVIGILWVTQLAWKLPPSFGCETGFAVSTDIAHRTAGLCDWTGLMGVYSLVPLHAALVRTVVSPNLGWMGWGIFILELAVAVSLVLGLLTRLGALLGLLQAVNLFIGLSGVPGEWYWSYGMLAVLQLVFFFTAAGRTLGLDAALIPSFRRGADHRGGLGSLLSWFM